MNLKRASKKKKHLESPPLSNITVFLFFSSKVTEPVAVGFFSVKKTGRRYCWKNKTLQIVINIPNKPLTQTPNHSTMKYFLDSKHQNKQQSHWIQQPLHQPNPPPKKKTKIQQPGPCTIEVHCLRTQCQAQTYR